MFSILCAVLFLIIAIITMLLALGFPLGEFAMGGKYKIIPKKLRIMAVVMILVQLFAMMITLQVGGFIPLWFSVKGTKYICFLFAVYLSLNTIMNLISNSKKEKYVMTPLAFTVAIYFWINGFHM